MSLSKKSKPTTVVSDPVYNTVRSTNNFSIKSSDPTKTVWATDSSILLTSDGNGIFAGALSAMDSLGTNGVMSANSYVTTYADFVKYDTDKTKAPIYVIQTLQSKAPLNAPSFTGNVSTDTDFVKRDPNGVLPDLSIITSLANKADAATTNASLALKADSSALASYATLASPAFTGTVTVNGSNVLTSSSALSYPNNPTFASITLGSQDLQTLLNGKQASGSYADASATTSALAAKAPLASPSFTGNVTIAGPIIGPTTYSTAPTSTEIGYKVTAVLATDLAVLFTHKWL